MPNPAARTRAKAIVTALTPEQRRWRDGSVNVETADFKVSGDNLEFHAEAVRPNGTVAFRDRVIIVNPRTEVDGAEDPAGAIRRVMARILRRRA